MKKLLVSLSLLISPILTCSEPASELSATASLASTEGLMNSIVAGHVSVISGDLIFHEQDLALPGPRPLLLQRTYCSGDPSGGFLYKGWGWTEPTPIFYFQNGESTFALVTTSQGARAKFKHWVDDKTKGRVYFDFEQTKGYTNTSSGKLSAKTNIKNNILSLTNQDKKYGLSGEVVASDGVVKSYISNGHQSGNWSAFIPREETNPNRSKKRFKYTAALYPLEIEQTNWGEDIVYGSFRYSYDTAKSTSVFSSTGKRVTYHFHKKSWTNKKGLSWDSYYLNHIESYERPVVKYNYTPSNRYDCHLIISEKTLPDGRGLKFLYYDKGDDLKDRIKEIHAPIGVKGQFLTSHSFTYVFNKDHGNNLLNGSTDVLDAYNRKTIYHYDKEERLTNILYHNNANEEIFADSFFYESESNLSAKYLRDPAWNIFKGQVFTYDLRGNVIDSLVFGKITGKNSIPIAFGSNFKPIENGTEKYGHHFYYGTGDDVLTEREDNGKGIRYTYYPDSSAVTSKLVINKDNNILLREFTEYDANLFVTKKIIDDGSSEEKDNLSGVTFRKITNSYPTKTAPFGLPHQVVEKFLDLNTNEEKQLKQIINEYTLDGKLSSQTVYDSSDDRHYKLCWEYDTHGNITKETNALKEEIYRRYDNNDNLIFEENTAQGIATHYYYDHMNRIFCTDERKDGRSFQTHHTYDLVGNKISTKDHQGHTTYFAYNDFNQLTSITHPPVNSNGIITQAVESFTYDLLGHQTSHKDKLGFVTYTDCNINGDPLKITYPDGTCEQFEYYLNGALEKTIHKNQSYTLYIRDCLNQVLSEETYSPDGNLLSQIKRVYKGNLLFSEEDAEGLLTTYAYDGAARLIEKITADTRITYNYDSFGNIFQETSWISESEAQVREFTYDFRGQVLSETCKNLTNEIFLHTENTYNAFGQKTTSKIGDSISQYFFSSHQELLKEIDPEGNVTEYLYDYQHILPSGLIGSKLQTIDANGNRTVQILDPLDREVKTYQLNSKGDLLSQKVSSYNLENDLLSVAEDRIVEGQVKSTYISEWAYNAVHQVTTQKENPGTPDERIKTFTYNNLGQKISHVNPDGVALFYKYDEKGRLSEFYTSDKSISYRYTYNRNDQIIEVEDLVNHQKTSRTFDSKGLLINETLGNGLNMSFCYDALDRRTSTILPDTSQIHYKYDEWNLKSVTYGDIHHQQDAYDAAGNLLKSTLPKQTGTLNYTYDLNQRKRSATHSKFQHTILENGLDKVGNLLSDHLKDPLSSITRHFTYDDLYQLTSEKGTEDHEYTYDSLNNRIAKDNAPSVINSLNQLLEQDNVSYTYDLNGNRSSKTEHGKLTLYFYDALNRMTSVITPDQHIKYVYDPFDRRLSKQDDQYLYDGQNEIGMFKNGTPQELRILSSNESSEHGTAIAIKLANETYIPIHDLFGNLSMILSPKGDKTYRYSAFGKELNRENSDLNPWRFASKRLDPDTGLIYFGRRYYDPETARWTSPDPAEFVDGANFHAYLRNNPLYRLDAYGLWGESFWEGSLAFGSGLYQGAYNMGEGFCYMAGTMGQWMHADMEYEYGNDPSAFHTKMQSSWDEWGELSNCYNESSFGDLGNAFALGCMKAYNLDAEASFSERWSTYGEAAFDVCLLGTSVFKAASAINNAAYTSINACKTNIALIGSRPVKSFTRNTLRKVVSNNLDTIHVTPQGVALPAEARYQIPKHYIENKFRPGSYGIENSKGTYIEKLRIDAPTPHGAKGPNYSHYHLDKKSTHYSPRPGAKNKGFN